MNYLQPHSDASAPNHINYFASSSPLAGNPHRRAFGSFSNDGSPVPNIPQGMFSPDDLAVYGLDDGGDQGDPKRRRIARACDMCRKKKIKCDGKMPACTHCQNYKTECIFTQVEKKRNPPKGAKYIEGLENRLGRMESLLRLSGLLSEEDGGATDLGTLEKKLADRSSRMSHDPNGTSSKRNSTPGLAMDASSPGSEQNDESEKSPTAQGSPKPTDKRRGDEEVEVLSDMMCSLVTNNCGETRYIGSSSGFSIFSPKGIQWVNEKTGDTSFQDMISTSSIDDNKWIQWKPDVFRDIFQRRVYKPLPPKGEALSLLRDYFENFNCMFPLFHEPTFMHLVDKHYSRDPYEGSGWWASLNVVLALAHRLRVMSNLVPHEEDQKAWGYMKNALAVQSELTMRNTDLLSIQALLGMSLFLQGTPNPQPSFFLVAAALRLAHSIGLHKRATGFGLNPSEVEQRRRVFWIAYMLDRDICLRSGRPTIQDDDDMNVDLPSENPPDNIGNIPLADGKGKVNLFRLMCTFAVIASKVYRQLYSVKASKLSDGELLNTIGELDRELEEWKDGIPIDFRPEHEIKASHTPLILHIVVLHFAYYNCLTTIHRMSVHHGYWTSRLSNYAIQGLNARPLNPRVFSSAALCVSAARASINLIKYIPHGDYDCVWLVLYYPVSALVTLFANILQNPQDSRASSDLKLMNIVVNFLSALCTDDENGGVRRMLSICSEFERIARIVLDKTAKESSSRRKRKQQDSTDITKPASTPISTPKPYVDSTPQPSQPGNIPNVFTPPDLNMYMPDESFTPFNPSADPMTPRHPMSEPNPSSWLSPGQHSSIPTPSPVMTARLPPNTGSFDFSVPSISAINSQARAVPLMNGGNIPIGPNHNGGVFRGPSGPTGMGNVFAHPFVPADLWQMPMTLDWDWADMTSGFSGIEEPVQTNGHMNNMHPSNGLHDPGDGGSN